MNKPTARESTGTSYRRIRSIRLGDPVLPTPNSGDLWTCAWAADGTLYTAADDTCGFEHPSVFTAPRAETSNLRLCRIDGDTPPKLTGATVNAMQEYGLCTEKDPRDDAMWKAMGLAAVDGVLYMSVSRHSLGLVQPHNRYAIQEAWDASIIASRDGGRSWSAKPELGKAMFPGRVFSTPMFVDFGRDGAIPAKDGADRYVYAVSNDGCWNSGTWMALGRVPRDRMPRLDSADWEFVQGFEEDGSPRWRPGHLQARAVFRAPGRTSIAGIHYVAGLDSYLMPQWHFPHQDDGYPFRARTAASRVEFWQAPKPWGPWELVHTHDFPWHNWYNPCLPTKFMSADGRRMWMLVSGSDWSQTPERSKFYALHLVPVEIDAD